MSHVKLSQDEVMKLTLYLTSEKSEKEFWEKTHKSRKSAAKLLQDLVGLRCEPSYGALTNIEDTLNRSLKVEFGNIDDSGVCSEALFSRLIELECRVQDIENVLMTREGIKYER